jgi:hypothetical protein
MAARNRQPFDAPPSEVAKREANLRAVPDHGPESLRIEDFSDVELLALVNDHADSDGYVKTEEMVLIVGLDVENARQCVGSRFSWLARYGAMEKNPDEVGSWRLSAVGLAMVKGNLSASEKRTLENLADEKLLSLARGVTNRYRSTGATGAQLMRREWQYGTSKRRFR